MAPKQKQTFFPYTYNPMKFQLTAKYPPDQLASVYFSRLGWWWPSGLGTILDDAQGTICSVKIGIEVSVMQSKPLNPCPLFKTFRS